jgi:glycine/D-amino acid oxidase-like deaminating enzyme
MIARLPSASSTSPLQDSQFSLRSDIWRIEGNIPTFFASLRMTEPTDEENRLEAEADAEADRQLDAVRTALNSALEDLSGEDVHPITIVQALILLAVQLAVGHLGREDARSLLNETLSDGLTGAAKFGIDEPTH